MADVRKNFACWKAVELCCYVGGGIGAVIASVAVGSASSAFNQKCPLYAQVKFAVSGEGNATSPREIRVVDESARLWSSTSECELSTYLPVGCAAYAFIMAYFILMCDRMEKSYSDKGSRNRMLGLFFPLLFSSTILSVLMLTVSVHILNGTSEFCDALLQSASVKCVDAQDYEWPDYPDAKYIYVTLLSAVTSSYLSMVACCLSVVVLIARCFAGVDRVPKPVTVAHRSPALRAGSPSTSVVSAASSKAPANVPLLSASDKKSAAAAAAAATTDGASDKEVPGPSKTSPPAP